MEKNELEVDIKVPNQTRYLSLIGRIGEDIAKELDGLVAKCPTKDPGAMPIELVKPVLDKAMDPRSAKLKSLSGLVGDLRSLVRE